MVTSHGMGRSALGRTRRVVHGGPMGGGEGGEVGVPVDAIGHAAATVVRREESWLEWKEVTVDGRPARYGEAGQGPPVLFLHGWGLDHKAYKRALSRLVRAGVHVYAPALPGFGGTSALPSGPNGPRRLRRLDRGLPRGRWRQRPGVGPRSFLRWRGGGSAGARSSGSGARAGVDQLGRGLGLGALGLVDTVHGRAPVVGLGAPLPGGPAHGAPGAPRPARHLHRSRSESFA